MPGYDFRKHPPLRRGAAWRRRRRARSTARKAHYLTHVLRLNPAAASSFSMAAMASGTPPIDAAEARSFAACRRQNARPDSSPPTCTICSRRSKPRGSTTWCRRRSRWASRGCSRCSPATARSRASIPRACARTASKPPNNAAFSMLPEIAEPAALVRRSRRARVRPLAHLLRRGRRSRRSGCGAGQGAAEARR